VQYAQANDFEVRPIALNVMAKGHRLGGPALIMGGIKFGQQSVWVLGPDWLSRKVDIYDILRRLGEAAAPVGGECRPCPDIASYTLALALQLRKITENLIQDNRKALG
jgi:hypothetical protein